MLISAQQDAGAITKHVRSSAEPEPFCNRTPAKRSPSPSSEQRTRKKKTAGAEQSLCLQELLQSALKGLYDINPWCTRQKWQRLPK